MPHRYKYYVYEHECQEYQCAAYEHCLLYTNDRYH